MKKKHSHKKKITMITGAGKHPTFEFFSFTNFSEFRDDEKSFLKIENNYVKCKIVKFREKAIRLISSRSQDIELIGFL